MSAPPPETGLAARLVDWMAANRPTLDRMMAEEGSRAIHEEFLLAESGTLPDRQTRIERARGASARAWMRHLGQGLEETWPEGGAGLAEGLHRWTSAHQERLEALVLEEQAVAERRGASGDPEADRRNAELIAQSRLFAEALATTAPPLQETAPPEFAREVARWARAHEARRREVEEEAVAGWGAGPATESETPMTAASSPELDELRVREAAAVWAHVRVLAEALEDALPGVNG